MAETDEITGPTLARLSKLPRSLFWRQNQGVFRTLDLRRVVHVTSIDGIADIMGISHGFPVAVETKRGKGKQRITQERFQEAWQAAGGLYIIVRHPDEAVPELAKHIPMISVF